MKQGLKLTSVGNARELGGYRIGEKTVKRGTLLRTASLAALSDEDKSILQKDYRVAVIVDLRMSIEGKVSPDPELEDVKKLHLPVMEAEDYPGFNDDVAKIITSPKADRSKLLQTALDMGMFSDRLYADFLFSGRGKSAFRGLFQCLLELPDDRALLWHCTDGKDRTGVAGMLILTALGASRETILSDYMLTNEFNEKKLSAARKALELAPMSDQIKELSLFGAGAVYQRYMENALLAMEENCGSPEAYLEKELGIGK